MKDHLTWNEILNALEGGITPRHLEDCPRCAARWKRAHQMMALLKPSEDSLETHMWMERTVATLKGGAQPHRQTLWRGLRWALFGSFCMALAVSGGMWLFHKGEGGKEKIAMIMAEDLSQAPGGLDILYPETEVRANVVEDAMQLIPDQEVGP